MVWLEAAAAVPANENKKAGGACAPWMTVRLLGGYHFLCGMRSQRAASSQQTGPGSLGLGLLDWDAWTHS